MTARKTAGHSAKHVSSSKHHVTSKHSPTAAKKKPAGTKARVTTKGTHAKHAKAVGFAIGDLLPVCAFEAVAQSLRLAGQPAHDDEVAELWHLLGEPAEGASVGEALAAAARFGLGGWRPSVIHELDMAHGTAQQHRELGALHVGQLQRLDDVTVALLDRDAPLRAVLFDSHGGDVGRSDAASVLVHALILGVDVPGPHAVLATPDGWWSWGELYSPWPCRVSEAWAVSWS